MKTHFDLKWIALFVVVVFLLPATAYSIDIVTQPADLNPGDTYHLAFITSLSYQATSTDISWYDAQVAARAAASPELNALGVDWFVIGSTSAVNARDHFVVDGPIYNLGDIRIADSHSDLWDGSDYYGKGTRIGSYISFDEFGNITYKKTWTGTDLYGGTDFPIARYGSSAGPLGSDSVNLGTSDHTDYGWIDLSYHPNYWEGRPSTNLNRLYGISAPLTVPEPIPEPTTIVMMGFGLLGLIGVVIRQRRKGK